MSTRSQIARQTKKGIESIYCHHDGCPEHHAPILVQHYASPQAFTRLLALGDLSVLGRDIGRKQDFRQHIEKHPDWCLAYGRDRGDKRCAKRAFRTEEAFLDHARKAWACYAYLFRDGRWVYRNMHDDHGWQDLPA